MSNIIVQKFGGTSLGTEERIASVAKIVKEASQSANVIVVVSAMSGETNRLIKLAKSFGDDPSKREFMYPDFGFEDSLNNNGTISSIW